jgi:hypothetical protein
MAKEQNLSLNQTKISGVCGRLMCCLKNEQETYEELNKRLPSIGDLVSLPDGAIGTVHSVNVLRHLVKVTVEINDEKELTEYSVEDLKFHSRRKKGKSPEKDVEHTEKGKDTREQNQVKEQKNVKEQKDKEKDKEAPAEVRPEKALKTGRKPKAEQNEKESKESPATVVKPEEQTLQKQTSGQPYAGKNRKTETRRRSRRMEHFQEKEMKKRNKE